VGVHTVNPCLIDDPLPSLSICSSSKSPSSHKSNGRRRTTPLPSCPVEPSGLSLWPLVGWSQLDNTKNLVYYLCCFKVLIHMSIPNCSSCKRESSSIMTREHPYCGDCFERMFIRRIKIGLSGPGKMKYSSKAVIHIRGTPSCLYVE
jgi:hypothetical protein